MGFFKDQMSKVVDKQIQDSNRQSQLSSLKKEADLERRMQLGQQLSESYLTRLDACIEQAEAKAAEIQEMEIPQTTDEYIAFVKLCRKKANMPLSDAFVIESNSSIKINKSHFDTKQPDKIIKKAWEDKLTDAIDMGEISFSTDPAVSAFLEDTTQQVKKDRQRDKLKMKLQDETVRAIGGFFIILTLMFILVFAMSHCS